MLAAFVPTIHRFIGRTTGGSAHVAGVTILLHLLFGMVAILRLRIVALMPALSTCNIGVLPLLGLPSLVVHGFGFLLLVASGMGSGTRLFGSTVTGARAIVLSVPTVVVLILVLRAHC